MSNRERGKAYRRHRRQAEQIAIPVLGKWGAQLLLGPNTKRPEILFGRSCRVAVADGLRWDVRLNASTSTLVLMGECLTRCAAKTKTRGKSDGIPWRKRSYALSKEIKDWLQKGYELFRKESGKSDRDFCAFQPLGSEGKNFTPVPSFWYCAYKMVTYLLDLVWLPMGHGVRPNSLKVTTISALTTNVADGQANLSQLAIQGNYRAVTAQDMAKVYFSDLAQQQLLVSSCDKNAFRNNASPESAKDDPHHHHPPHPPRPPAFPGIRSKLKRARSRPNPNV